MQPNATLLLRASCSPLLSPPPPLQAAKVDRVVEWLTEPRATTEVDKAAKVGRRRAGQGSVPVRCGVVERGARILAGW